MKLVLEPADITAIADAVMQQLAPVLAEFKALASIPLKSQQIQASIPCISAKPRQDMLKRSDLPEITGLSASTIARMESKGLFPARVQLSSKRVGWRLSEVELWVDERRQAA